MGEVQRYFPVPRDAVMLKLDSDTSGGYVTAADYAALQARIAELEAEKTVANAKCLDWFERANQERIARQAAEARNAASERDAGRYRWLCAPDNASVRLLREDAAWPDTLDEAIDAAIDAHAQGQDNTQGEPC